MNTETRRTLAVVTLAVALSLLAWGTVPGRSGATRDDPDALFFPAFTDPNAASSLEIVEVDPVTSDLRPFKVSNRDGRWTIPSHADYPADGSTRLSSVAAALVSLRRGEPASDLAADHERFGVLDPLEETLAAPPGYGIRVTVRGTNDVVLADLIVGQPLEGRPALRYVRLPEERRVYTAEMGDLALSTRFEDWIERNLLLLDRDDIDQVVIRNYTADLQTGTVRERDRVILRSTGADEWTADGLRSGEGLDRFTMNLLITRLVELEIASVVPKPPSVAARLMQPGGGALVPADVAELSARGFYFTADGRLLSSQGEVLVHTRSGIFYVLRFGESAPGRDAPGRYLFISTGFDGPAGPPPQGETRDRLDLLRARFAPWYYVVADEDVSKIRVPRSDLVSRQSTSR